MQQLEAHLRVWQGEPQDGFGDVPELGGRTLDELPPCGCVVEEVADLDGGADVPRRRLRVRNVAAAVVHLVGGFAPGHAAEDAGVRDGADARQRLAAEPHRRDAEQVLVGLELAGGV
jgi:hypothetical protein